MKQKQGFTLAEIMIVVLIIGLLAVIGIPYILNAYNNSLGKTKARNISEVEKAKGVLSLPPTCNLPGAMGLSDTTLELADDPAGRSNLCAALSLDTLDELEVDGASIQVGTLAVKASYDSN